MIRWNPTFANLSQGKKHPPAKETCHLKRDQFKSKFHLPNIIFSGDMLVFRVVTFVRQQKSPLKENTQKVLMDFCGRSAGNFNPKNTSTCSWCLVVDMQMLEASEKQGTFLTKISKQKPQLMIDKESLQDDASDRLSKNNPTRLSSAMHMQTHDTIRHPIHSTNNVLH